MKWRKAGRPAEVGCLGRFCLVGSSSHGSEGCSKDPVQKCGAPSGCVFEGAFERGKGASKLSHAEAAATYLPLEEDSPTIRRSGPESESARMVRLSSPDHKSF